MVLRPLLEARRSRRVRTEVAPLVGLDPAEAARTSRPTLRIAHFSDTYEPRRDGIITVLQTLTATMKAGGHESLIVVPRHPDQADDPSLLKLPSVPCGVAQFRLASWPREKHVERIAHWLPHVIHVHTPGPIGLLGILAARRLGLPLVQTYHTDLRAYADAYRLPTRVIAGVVRASAVRLGRPTPEMPSGLPFRVGRKERRDAVVDAGIELLYGEADAVLVPTPAILTRCRLPVEDDRVYVAPAGVELPTVAPTARADFRREHGIADDEKVVLFVGRINREKGIDLLTSAFGRVAREVPKARLLLVGAVYEQKWVQGLLDEAGIADRTVLTDQVSPSEAARAYAAADVFGFPSLTETQGLVLQEASLAGLPSVLADSALHASGPMAGAGVLAGPEVSDFADAISRLLTDDEHRSAVAAGARQLAERNSPTSFADRMAAVYGQAVRRGATATRLARKARRGPFKSRRRFVA